MSQREWEQAFDDAAHLGFAAAGIADQGVYTPAGGASLPCRVYVDAGTQLGYESAYGPRTVLSLLRADVPAPQQGASVEVDGRLYVIDAPVDADDGVTRWVVRHV